MLIQTNTNEFYLPSRLIYRIKNKNSVVNKLKRLQCAGKHAREERWMIACTSEALAIADWEDAYMEADKRGDPIIIAYLRFVGKTNMHVYVRSYERVTPALNLLDKYLPHEIAIGTHHDIYQQLVMIDNPTRIPSPESFFADESKITYSDNLRKVDVLEEKARRTGVNYDEQIDELFFKEFQPGNMQSSELADLQRLRLEVFYTDGAEDYERAMNFKKTMVLAKNEAGGSLDTVKFVTKVLQNGGKKITNMKELLS